MKAYETSATVEDHGRVNLAGVPFAPGTKVEVVISPVNDAPAVATPAARAARLLATLDTARNSQPIGTFRRADRYNRLSVRPRGQ